jgi:hypothetical protein
MNTKNATQTIIAALTIASATGISSADIMSSSPTLSVANGTFMTPDLTHNSFESDDFVRLYRERTAYTLQSALKLDVTATGSGGGNDFSVGDLQAGEQIRSYFLHFDPASSSTVTLSGGFQLTSDEEIVGIIFSEARMAAADNIVGRSGVTYPTSFSSRGYDANNDFWTISANRRTFQFTVQAGLNGLDQARIITRQVPAPGALAMCGLGGLVAAKRRRK